MAGGAQAALLALWVAAVRAAAPLLEPFLERVRLRDPAVASLCSEEGGYGPNFFLTHLHPETGLTSLEVAVIESVLFNHPLARVFVFAFEVDQALLDAHLREGYCVVTVPLQLTWLQGVVRALEPELGSGRFVSMSADRRAVPFLLNCALLALQLTYGGVTLAMDGLLLNPFDFMLPAPLSLQTAAVFLERTLGPEEPAPPWALQAEDFERSWAPRSHTDRADGRTTLCGEHLCPRAMPKECPLGRELLRAWLTQLLREGALPRVDEAATRLYRAYLQERPLPGDASAGPEVQKCHTLALPGWVMVEPHFADGWRYYGHRGEEEAEDRPHFHSQLFSPRAHRERPDWWLVRSLKLWLPLDYGPPSARNVLPRSAVDLARRLLSLRVAPRSPGPLRFGAPPAQAAAASGSSLSWRVPADAFDALDNSMAESLGIGQVTELPREAALPGTMGGFRTFRDIRVIGRSGCPATTASHVRAHVQMGTGGAAFFCQRAARPEAAAAAESAGEVAAGGWCAVRIAAAAAQASRDQSNVAANPSPMKARDLIN